MKLTVNVNDDYSFTVKFTDLQRAHIDKLSNLTDFTASDVVKLLILGGILMVQVVEEMELVDVLYKLDKIYRGKH